MELLETGNFDLGNVTNNTALFMSYTAQGNALIMWVSIGGIYGGRAGQGAQEGLQ